MKRTLNYKLTMNKCHTTQHSTTLTIQTYSFLVILERITPIKLPIELYNKVVKCKNQVHIRMQIQFLEVIFGSSGGALMLDMYSCILNRCTHCACKTDGIQCKNMDLFNVEIHNILKWCFSYFFFTKCTIGIFHLFLFMFILFLKWWLANGKDGKLNLHMN